MWSINENIRPYYNEDFIRIWRQGMRKETDSCSLVDKRRIWIKLTCRIFPWKMIIRRFGWWIYLPYGGMIWEPQSFSFACSEDDDDKTDVRIRHYFIVIMNSVSGSGRNWSRRCWWIFGINHHIPITMNRRRSGTAASSRNEIIFALCSGISTSYSSFPSLSLVLLCHSRLNCVCMWVFFV